MCLSEMSDQPAKRRGGGLFIDLAQKEPLGDSDLRSAPDKSDGHRTCPMIWLTPALESDGLSRCVGKVLSIGHVRQSSDMSGDSRVAGALESDGLSLHIGYVRSTGYVRWLSDMSGGSRQFG